MKPNICDCGHPPTNTENSCASGYAVDTRTNKTMCYDCASADERDTLIKEGNNKTVPLYLIMCVGSKICPEKITDWSGRLEFPVFSYKYGKHNIWGYTRVDVYIHGPDGYVWWGWTLCGNMRVSELIHVRRTKERSRRWE